VFVVLLIGTPLTVVFVAANAIAARLFRVPCIGFGVWSVPLAVFRIGRCVVKVGALPNPSAYAKLAGFDDLPPTSPVDIREGERRYDELHPFQRLMILLAGPATTLSIAIALLGWPEGWDSMVRGFQQRWMSCWSPRAFAHDVLVPFLQKVQSADYRYVLGSVAAKQTAENMYPIPIVTGGLAALELWHLMTGRKVRPRTRMIFQYVGLAVLLWLFVAMAIATYTAVSAM
jgi:membrane-associated protease RseP (regulator of RpoE activity)